MSLAKRERVMEAEVLCNLDITLTGWKGHFETYLEFLGAAQNASWFSGSDEHKRFAVLEGGVLNVNKRGGYHTFKGLVDLSEIKAGRNEIHINYGDQRVVDRIRNVEGILCLDNPQMLTIVPVYTLDGLYGQLEVVNDCTKIAAIKGEFQKRKKNITSFVKGSERLEAYQDAYRERISDQ